MKSIPKLIRRFVGIMTLSIVLLIILNFLILAIVVADQSPNGGPWDTARQVAEDLKFTDNGYVLSEEILVTLKEQDIWAIFISNDTNQIVWQTSNLPNSIPKEYTLSDISNLTRGYINGFPTFPGENESGLLVLGYPQDSYWKHMWASWDYKLISNFPKIIILVFSGNMLLIFIIYIIANSAILRSVKPITNAIQCLPTGKPVHITETGLLSDIAENINKTSAILQEQNNQLRKKENARANWIAGVSHDIRTPLSMIMGYAGQLGSSQNMSDVERKKAKIILKQSERMKNLINNLNLASKLEYNMQPLMKTRENVIAILRQVVVDFMNMNLDNKFPLEWKTEDALSTCVINVDKDLLKRAIVNIIQNSISHNQNGCTIYVSVEDTHSDCLICIEDSGIGATDEQIKSLNLSHHYMVCDTNTTEQRHGLGLLIVKQIVAAHNGKVIINRSTTYGGFKVDIKLPLIFTLDKFLYAKPEILLQK